MSPQQEQQWPRDGAPAVVGRSADAARPRLPDLQVLCLLLLSHTAKLGSWYNVCHDYHPRITAHLGIRFAGTVIIVTVSLSSPPSVSGLQLPRPIAAAPAAAACSTRRAERRLSVSCRGSTFCTNT